MVNANNILHQFCERELLEIGGLIFGVENITVLLSSLNPVDLGRIYIMLHMDVSALMGYTGATYKDIFGSNLGTLFTLGVMLVWIVVPLLLALRSFNKKDL